MPDFLDRMTAARDELTAELAAGRDNETCRELLDLDRIDPRCAPGQIGSTTSRTSGRCTARTGRWLLRGLLMARYIRFFEDHARDRRIRSANTAGVTALPAELHGATVTAGPARSVVETPILDISWGNTERKSARRGLNGVPLARRRSLLGRGRRPVVVQADAGDRPVPWLHSTVSAFVLAQQGRFALHRTWWT